MEGRRALERAAELGIDYVESLAERPVAPTASLEELRETFEQPLPEGPTDAVTVVEELARDVEPGLTQMGGGRMPASRRCRRAGRPGWAERRGMGRRAIRVSVSNWQTSESDVERTVAAFEAARSAAAAH